MTTDNTRIQPTADIPHNSPFREYLHATLAVALACTLAFGLALAVAGAATAQEGPTVRVTDASVEPGETATVRVVLTSAPDGLAGYELALSVADGEAATVAGANYPDTFGLTTDPTASDGGRTIRLEAADVEAGATNVTLATVELRGEAVGEVRLDVRPVQFDADGGAAMDVDVEVGSVVVGEPEPTSNPTAEPTTTEGGETVGGSGSEGTGTADDGEGTPTLTGTSGQGSLPLAGVGVAALAVGLVAAVLARRR